jgi:hypothetical protein
MDEEKLRKIECAHQHECENDKDEPGLDLRRAFASLLSTM